MGFFAGVDVWPPDAGAKGFGTSVGGGFGAGAPGKGFVGLGIGVDVGNGFPEEASAGVALGLDDAANGLVLVGAPKEGAPAVGVEDGKPDGAATSTAGSESSLPPNPWRIGIKSLDFISKAMDTLELSVCATRF